MGSGNDLVVRNSDDLRLFRGITMGHQVVMGRRTYESIGKPLEGRHNIVISSSLPYSMNTIVRDSTTLSIARSVEDVMDAQNDARDPWKTFVIGGAQVLEQFFPYLTALVVHRFDVESDGDVILNPKYRERFELQCEVPESGFVRELWTPRVHP